MKFEIKRKNELSGGFRAAQMSPNVRKNDKKLKKKLRIGHKVSCTTNILVIRSQSVVEPPNGLVGWQTKR